MKKPTNEKPMRTLDDFADLAAATAKLTDVTARRDAVADEIADLERQIADTESARERQEENARRLLAGQPAISGPTSAELASEARRRKEELGTLTRAVELQAEVVLRLRGQAITELQEHYRPQYDSSIKATLTALRKADAAVIELQSLITRISPLCDDYSPSMVSRLEGQPGQPVLPVGLHEALAECCNGWMMNLRKGGWLDEPESKPPTRRVKLLTSMSSPTGLTSGHTLAYGEEAEFPAETAERLVESGSAILLPSRSAIEV